VVLDEALRVVDANPEYVKMTGHRALHEMAGRPLVEWTVPEDRDRHRRELLRCLETGTVRNLEVTCSGPYGRITPVEINATVRRSPASGLTILGICRDVTERRRAEEALRNSEHLYRATIDALGEALHVVDCDLCIELLNTMGESWLEEIGVSGPFVGRTVFEVFPFLSAEVAEEYRRVFAGEGPLITEETSFVNGREIATETRKIPVVEDGRVVKVVTVIRDVTEAVRAQERLRQTEKMEALGRLAGGIAHDFNNQLSAVMGYAELLARGIRDPELREYAKMIALVVERSADLTRQLMTFARKGRAPSEPVDVHALLAEVDSILARTIDPRISIRLKLEAPTSFIMGDRTLLQNAFINLALNARDAMPAGGVLTFATDATHCEPSAAAAGQGDRGHACLRIRVSDTGAGMSEEVKSRIFEPFYTTKELGAGTGIGLATVYGTIAEHRGTISVESERGSGTTFTLLLPLSDQSLTEQTPRRDEALVAGRGHILLADDDPVLRRMLEDALAKLGYRVTACSDGAEALTLYREAPQTIDLVFLDVMMPSLSGLSVLATMREQNPEVRAVLCSARPLETNGPTACGAFAFLQKPFSLAEMARVIAAEFGRN
jgi:PAS domain S-box-containing protein